MRSFGCALFLLCEGKRMQEKKLTGYPSIDKPWLRYYDHSADERALDIPEDKTLWDVFEERLRKYSNFPAIEYFGRTIS